MGLSYWWCTIAIWPSGSEDKISWPSLSSKVAHPCTRLVGSAITWIFLPLLCRWHPTVSLFSSILLSHSSECPADISAWKLPITSSSTLVKLNSFSFWGKTPLNLSVTVKDVTLLPSSVARNLGVILDDRLSCTPNITAVVLSCRFAIQLLVYARVISCLDYCNSLLAGLRRLNCCSVSRTLQNASFSIYPNSPRWPPSSVTSNSSLLRTTSDWRRWYWPS